MAKKILCIYTKFYPYSKYEVHVDNEIKVLSKYFDEIHVFPSFKDETVRSMPSNVFLNNEFIEAPKQKGNIKDLIFSFAMTFSNLFTSSFIRRMKNFANDFSFIYAKKKQSEDLIKILQQKKLIDNFHYSVWLNDWASVLSILKSQRRIQDFYCRAHGYDMYHHRYSSCYVPFRDEVMRWVKSVACVSDAGWKYLSNEYPAYKDKIKLFPLGVFDQGQNPFEKNGSRFVTACNVNEVKRVHLIVEALKKTKMKIEWVHFGEGPLLNEIKESLKSMPSNVSVIMNGRVDSKELFTFYATVPVNAFILVSSTEGGVPVAIQEAMSFGIPVIGTRVGGIPEILNEKNGILLETTFETEKLAQLLDSFSENSLNSMETRNFVRNNWNMHFNAENNYAKFAEFILKQ